MAICNCDVGLSNTGLPNCAPIFSVTKKLILVPTYKADGTKNFIDLTATLDPAYLTAAINDADTAERWFPLPYFENVTSDRAESSFEDAPSGRKAFIKQGTRTMTGEIWGKDALPQLVGQINDARCVNLSAYVVDLNGAILGIGSADADTILYPIKLDAQSVDAVYTFATDSTTTKLTVTLSWDDSEKDKDLYMIQDTIDFTFDALDTNGLLDVKGVHSSPSVTGFVTEMNYIYGSLKSLVPDTGLLVGDFSLYNNTSAASVTITSVTESPDGTYTFVIPTQTSADVKVLTPSKDGRSYTDVIALTITIP